MTGCSVEYSAGMPYLDVRQNVPMAETYEHLMRSLWNVDIPESGPRPDEQLASASTDFGNVSLRVPGIHPAFTIGQTDSLGLHTVEFRDQAYTDNAQLATLRAATALSVAGTRALVDPGYLQSIKDHYKAHVLPDIDAASAADGVVFKSA
ncbi:hypothetical protein GQ42DRAFT_128834 [Ramicandelaber brevisporus]|nr:hypothetical protein GQ42DRAFT_128834 [Ramicandelaber brevisporus]